MLRQTKATIGFLCRWGILVFAALVVVSASWSAISSTARFSRRNVHLQSANLILPRWGGQKPIAKISGTSERIYSSVIVISQTNGARAVTRSPWRNIFYLNSREFSALENRFIVRGIPWGKFCFESVKSSILKLEKFERLFLLDIATAIQVHQADASALDNHIGALARMGRVAFFRPFSEVRPGDDDALILLRNEFGDTPTLDGEIASAFFRIRDVVQTGVMGWVGFCVPPRIDVWLITCDADLAKSAGQARGVKVNLMTHHKQIAEFILSLSAASSATPSPGTDR